jgi:hypothetical protein
MKRFVIVLLALLLAGAAVFGQQNPPSVQTVQSPQAQQAAQTVRSVFEGWSFSGFMYSTMGYDIDQRMWGGTDVMIDGASMSFLYYTRMGVDLDRNNYGFALSLMGISGYDTAASMRAPLMSIYQAYGWMKFFDKKLEVKVGAVRDSTFNSGGGVSTDGGEGAGALAKFNPFSGLTLGVGLYAPRLPTASQSRMTANTTTGAITTAFTDPRITSSGIGPIELATISWGVVYELPKVFKIATAGSWRDDTFPIINGGINLLAVPGLTLNVEFLAMNTAYKREENGFPMMVLDQTATYRLGKSLSFGVRGYQFFNGSHAVLSKGGGGTVFGLPAYKTTVVVTTPMLITTNVSNTYKVGYSVDPWVSYSIGMFTPRLGMSFEGYENTNEMDISSAFGSSNTTTKTQRNLISLKPSCSVRLGLASLDFSYTLAVLNDTVNDDKLDTVFDNKLTLMFAMVF